MKVGVVGRTGAGKSSILQALFRLTDVEEGGSIEIDGVNIQDVGLHLLRKNIAYIPQSPFLMPGTIRENLDPFDEFTNEQIQEVLENVQLWDTINVMDHGLLTQLKDSNSVFSVGQKQLICLARALLMNNKILVLDEATANIDLETDNLIQLNLRENFQNHTILIIAHRLTTVIDADRILVMDEGQAIEFDHPFTLLADSTEDLVITRSSQLSDMVKATGEESAQYLFDIARNHYLEHNEFDLN